MTMNVVDIMNAVSWQITLLVVGVGAAIMIGRSIRLAVKRQAAKDVLNHETDMFDRRTKNKVIDHKTDQGY